MALELLDWRRRTFESYREVRRLAADDPAAAHACWRSDRDVLFGGHPQSPLSDAARKGFDGLPVDAYDPALRFEVEVDDADAEPARLEVTTGTDGRVAYERLGVVRLPGLGSLDVWWLAAYGGGVWLPARDASGDTYGGGRYVLDTIKGADLGGDGGRLVVDLNFAYNPSCAYDPAWACPLAPPGNTLAAALPGGERMPATGWA